MDSPADAEVEFEEPSRKKLKVAGRKRRRDWTLHNKSSERVADDAAAGPADRLRRDSLTRLDLRNRITGRTRNWTTRNPTNELKITTDSAMNARGGNYGAGMRGRGGNKDQGMRGRGGNEGQGMRGRSGNEGQGMRGRGGNEGQGMRGTGGYEGQGMRGRGGNEGQGMRGRGGNQGHVRAFFTDNNHYQRGRGRGWREKFGGRGNTHADDRMSFQGISDNRSGNDAHHFSDNTANTTSQDGGSQSRNDFNRGERRSFVTFKYLEKLLEKESEDFIAEISGKMSSLLRLFHDELSPDLIVLIVKVFRRVCDTDFTGTKYVVLQRVFDNKWVDHLQKYIMLLPAQSEHQKNRNKYFWNDPSQFWENLIVICKELVNTTPNSVASKDVKKILEVIQMTIPNLENFHRLVFDDELKKNVADLLTIIQTLNTKQAELKNGQPDDEPEPGDEFRKISVLPTALEVLSERNFIRKNVIDRAYKNVEHYLDVQFRLLREDFIAPLRTGIATYLSNSHKRLENVRVHKKVMFLCAETVDVSYCVRLKFHFDKNKKLSFNFENSKKFMYGSLLCFTSDNFKSIIFGKVVKRDKKDLENGELIVGFDNNEYIMYGVDYVMVECSVYFEPYFHVLNALKVLNSETFPMKKYIIDADATEERPPYLTDETRYLVNEKNCDGHNFIQINVRVNPALANLHEDRPQLRHTRDWSSDEDEDMFMGDTIINPFSLWCQWKPSQWPPNTVFYDMNESQSAAFKAALTRKFSIIQGPPGTGKTYVGLRIVQTLLENSKIWFNNTPLLVVCFTNHALDQFLEGLLPVTNSILRLGGQSNNEKLGQFSINKSKRLTHIEYRAFLERKDRITNALRNIQDVTELLKQMNAWEGVFSFYVFPKNIPELQNSFLSEATDEQVYRWLMGGQLDLKKPSDKNAEPVQEHAQDVEAVDDDVDDDERRVDDDDLFQDLLKGLNNRGQDHYLVSLRTLNNEVQRRTLELDTFLATPSENDLEALFRAETEYFLQMKVEQAAQAYACLENNLANLRNLTPSWRPAADINLANLPNLPIGDRWKFYFYLLNTSRAHYELRLKYLNEEFRKQYESYEEMQQLEDVRVMRSKLVIGMTTTRAARIRRFLGYLKCPIVVVEEAAEILEPHVVAALTQHCQHLILIGDHQQLQPNTADFVVGQKLKLGISLFERMVLNKVECHTLNVQHRMRPEISKLICPTIYPNLQDHDSVKTRPKIVGMSESLYFVDHQVLEESCQSTSKKNIHEASFLVALANHLVLNGYRLDQITILAAYLGQFFEIQRRKSLYQTLEKVRVSALDNYQGEECDIILLSLVRSNEEKKIGFLSIQNRVCVALSRARNGFYVIGNMAQLCHQSKLWQEIKQTLNSQNAVGPELHLRCQIHQDTITKVKCAEDFLAISEGGCNNLCRALLACGHYCKSLCHPSDRMHKEHKCREPCTRSLCDRDETHMCKKLCFEECGPCTYKVQRKLNCRHEVLLDCHLDPETHVCTVLVNTELPCKHEAKKPCHRDAQTFRCPEKCDAIVESCGHACVLSCHVREDPDHLEYKCKKRCARFMQECTKEIDDHICRKLCYEECDKCEIKVKKFREKCKHAFDVPCHIPVDDIQCKKPCQKNLPCGHKCKKLCHQPCGDCAVKVSKIIEICGHSLFTKCCEHPDRKRCSKKCPLKLPCGHPCTEKCNRPCTAKCRTIVDCSIRGACGHMITKLECHMLNSALSGSDPNVLKHCSSPCNSTLKCEHKCTGTCGKCVQGRFHTRCSYKCPAVLVCNHSCPFPCSKACQSCTEPCFYRCRHSACKKKCGEVCVPCNEPCARNCEHQRCPKRCHQICSVPPCTQPCNLRLQCGHNCIGFCGDACPPKCSICDQDEVREIFFGFEEEADARFVYLRDCRHVMESEGMEAWLKQGNENVGFKVCPKCSTPIKTTLRYSDYVKRAMADVTEVKIKTNGSFDANAKEAAEIFQRSNLLQCKHTEVNKILDILETRLKPVHDQRRQPINRIQLNVIRIKVELITMICKIFPEDIEVFNEHVNDLVQRIGKVILRELDFITDQEIDDVSVEISKLTRMVQFATIKQKSPVGLASDPKCRELSEKIQNLTISFRRFKQEDNSTLETLLTELKDKLKLTMTITTEERNQILKAMGLNRGHWFKCPNNHIYAIGDCGGAMEESKCYECNERIGGSSHQVLRSNALATEMDGATLPAYPTLYNNLNNFNLDGLM